MLKNKILTLLCIWSSVLQCIEYTPQEIESFVSLLVWYDNKIILYSYLKSRNAYISIIRDMRNEKYLVKQKKGKSEKANLNHAILETVNSFMANELNIPCQKVWLIPASLALRGKEKATWAASLHSYIKGQEARERFALKEIFNIYKSKSSPVNLLRQVIFKLSKYPYLIRLFALDSFIGNHDRKEKNMIYVTQEDTCYAIDMGSSFNKDYAILIKDVIQKWIDSHVIFDTKEKAAIKVYKQALEDITLNFPPERLMQLCKSFFKAADTSFSENDILKTTYKMIIQNYESTLSLIKKLKVLIDTF